MTDDNNIQGTVLLLGAGGIGCGAAFALAAARVARIVIMDDDRVDETNLHRQILHSPESVGAPKVLSLARALTERFPSVAVETVEDRFDATNAAARVPACDVVIDGTDNLPAKFLANDAAVLGRRPLIHGAAIESWGQLLTVAAGGRPCYRCLFEELPPTGAGVDESCASAGVLGPVPGLIGALQAAEAVRFVRREAPAYLGRVIRYDSRFLTMRSVRFRANPGCGVCGNSPTINSLAPERYRSTGSGPESTTGSAP
jgi:adenylyltransferase/sulfurtransferase